MARGWGSTLAAWELLAFGCAWIAVTRLFPLDGLLEGLRHDLPDS